MKHAIVTVGISCSGKTTWAEEFSRDNGYNIVCRDYFRRMIQFNEGIPIGKSGVNWKKWNWKKEKDVTLSVWDLINAISKFKNPNLIVADTNLNSNYRKNLIEELEKLDYVVAIKEFPITIEEAWERDAARENGVGHSVIAKQFSQWNEYLKSTDRLPFIDNDSNPNGSCAIICDIDGTIAINTGNRSPYDWKNVIYDVPNEKIRRLLIALRYDYNIIYVSGRDESCRKETEQWLTKHFFPDGQVYMRSEGDTRKDYLVKEELFFKYINGKHNVCLVLDDRPQVIRNTWQKLGLTTLIVGNPWIEF